MLTRYVVSHADQPHLAVFVATTLDKIALAISAQLDRTALDIYANNGSFNRPLNADERPELDAYLTA